MRRVNSMPYVKPEIEIIRFEETDVITNSYETPIIPAGGGDGFPGI